MLIKNDKDREMILRNWLEHAKGRHKRLIVTPCRSNSGWRHGNKLKRFAELVASPSLPLNTKQVVDWQSHLDNKIHNKTPPRDECGTADSLHTSRNLATVVSTTISGRWIKWTTPFLTGILPITISASTTPVVCFESPTTVFDFTYTANGRWYSAPLA